MRKLLVASFLSLGLLGAYGASPASALILSFENISANSVGDAAIGEAQLFVDITDPGSNRVSFRFFNTGPLASSITDVYFDDGTLLGIAQLIDADDGIGGDAGVDFSQGASPPNLPAANNVTPAFQTTAGFLADSDPPAQPNGVNPGEQLIVIFDLLAGKTFADTLAALDLGGATGGLRIGIHVQGFASGGSETFVNNGRVTVPEPGTLGLMSIGLLGIGFAVRRRRLAA